MSLNAPVFIKDDTESSEQTNLSNVPLHGMPLQDTTDNSPNLAWTAFNNTALGGVYPHRSGWDEYEPPEEWPDDIQPGGIQPDDVQDDDYEPPEGFAATDNEIIEISDDDESQGNGDEHISTAEVVPEVRATQREAEPIGTFKHDHADPRERRVVFLRFDHKGVVILRLSNLTMRNTSPTLPSGAQGTRGSVDWMHVDYFREIRQIDSTLTKATVESYVFNKLKERGLPQQWLIPSYEILKVQPYLRTMHADRITCTSPGVREA
ncbi:hypothetical protein CNMCM8980_001892 [Aspergillus fumigatiaffinis]|jgi:hypothetical protein|uniref:Uncharacterized protein n=1 Tax=Aspergillus fumigatiaffinis TaxID=340414 RepID=A0A8H4GH19_9EURO|nr:hypothetical protein CNMCM5878_001587 [Aspergillus fumigatiaffinis]KAF4220864.1 hypothetical protein CNMCM6457_002194 [Aspergillus fumigatiaffinis]KAF4228516.1 hypothetical protein CNMCM6805_002122 [Aspergillus fumigatiaffinis]KAF4238661.1 hypothetical protein CNMCM8980_001892 [Aspergillus fumigatiaffinis]